MVREVSSTTHAFGAVNLFAFGSPRTNKEPVPEPLIETDTSDTGPNDRQVSVHLPPPYTLPPLYIRTQYQVDTRVEETDPHATHPKNTLPYTI